MQKMYAIAFQRILNRLGKEGIEVTSVRGLLSSQGYREVGDFVYHRLPREEFRNFAKVPCPVLGDSTTDEAASIIIDASKRIRSSFSIDEKKVCNRCALK